MKLEATTHNWAEEVEQLNTLPEVIGSSWCESKEVLALVERAYRAGKIDAFQEAARWSRDSATTPEEIEAGDYFSVLAERERDK